MGQCVADLEARRLHTHHESVDEPSPVGQPLNDASRPARCTSARSATHPARSKPLLGEPGPVASAMAHDGRPGGRRTAGWCLRAHAHGGWRCTSVANVEISRWRSESSPRGSGPRWPTTARRHPGSRLLPRLGKLLATSSPADPRAVYVNHGRLRQGSSDASWAGPSREPGQAVTAREVECVGHADGDEHGHRRGGDDRRRDPAVAVGRAVGPFDLDHHVSRRRVKPEAHLPRERPLGRQRRDEQTGDERLR